MKSFFSWLNPGLMSSRVHSLNDAYLRPIEMGLRRLGYKITGVKRPSKKIFRDFQRAPLLLLKNLTTSCTITISERCGGYAKPQYYYEVNDLEFCSLVSYQPIILKNASIIGGSNIVVTGDGRAIYELEEFNSHKRYANTDSSFLSLDGDELLITYNKSSKKLASGINFCTNFSFNYYHFLLETVAKFYYLQHFAFDKTLPLIFDDAVSKFPQYREIVNIFNLDQRKLIFLKRGECCPVGQLHFLPVVNFIPPEYVSTLQVDYHDCIFNLESLIFLKTEAERHKNTNKYGKRIFISRNNSSSRRSYNEAEVKSIFQRFGFEVYAPEKLSFVEQVSLFNGAEFVAGATGAAMTNILFCAPGCKVLCLTNKCLDLSIFSTPAKLVGADFQYFVGDCDDSSDNLHNDFYVDVKKLECILTEFIEK